MAYNQAGTSQIKPGSITNEHLSPTTKIDENKLNLSNITASIKHPYAEDKQIIAADPLIGLDQFDLTADTFVAGDKSLNVFINGMLQMETVHYTEVVDDISGEGTGIQLVGNTFVEGDVIQLRWMK